MKPLPTLLVFFAFACATMSAADREFKGVVETISLQLHARPTHIPLFGLVNAITFVARPAGTKHIDLAVFDDIEDNAKWSRHNALAAIREAVGVNWKPFIQVRSDHNGREETIVVYLRPNGNDWKLLIATVQSSGAVVVQLELNPDGLRRWVSSPDESARSWTK